MTIHLTATGLRAAADMLDKLNGIESETGIRFDGAYNGHVMLTIGSGAGEGGVIESLRLVRLSEEQISPNVDAPATYALEFEAP